MARSRLSFAFVTAAAVGIGGCVQVQTREQAIIGTGYETAARANRGETVNPRKELADALIRVGIADPAAKQSAEEAFWLAYLYGTYDRGPYRMGGEGGADGGGNCWVARAVYGADDPRWRAFRAWLLEDAPGWFRALYLRHGQRVARWIARHRGLKSLLRCWMDARIAGKLHAWSEARGSA